MSCNHEKPQGSVTLAHWFRKGRGLWEARLAQVSAQAFPADGISWDGKKQPSSDVRSLGGRSLSALLQTYMSTVVYVGCGLPTCHMWPWLYIVIFMVKCQLLLWEYNVEVRAKSRLECGWEENGHSRERQWVSSTLHFVQKGTEEWILVGEECVGRTGFVFTYFTRTQELTSLQVGASD